MPNSDRDFHTLILETVRGIGNQLASNSGVIITDEIRRLESNLHELGSEATTEYDCLLHFYAYDQNKQVHDEEFSRDCLQRAAQRNSSNSSIWASWAFLQFLDWTKANSDSKPQLLDQSLTAVRRAIRLDPNSAVAHEYLGSILMAVGKKASALESYKKAMELNPSKPDVHVLFGWHKVLDGAWDEGIAEIQAGVQMSPSAPGWMRIPLSINAFRQGNFEEALSEAILIIESGDNRGVVLALAASISLKRSDLIKEYSDQFRALSTISKDDPMAEIKAVFNSSEILQKYIDVLKGVKPN